jgi:group I intron endonuclease
MKERYAIYKHTNKLNGKVYIGQTKREVEERWSDGVRNYNQHFRNAIKKYGWENFDHEIVSDNLTFDEANKLEKILIERFESMNPDKGYNKTSGGKKFDSLSEDTKTKIGKSVKESQLFMKRNYETHSKRVVGISISSGEIVRFNSLREASEFSGATAQNIGNCCAGRARTARNYVWRFDDENFKGFDYKKIKDIKKLPQSVRKKISDNHKRKKIVPIKAIKAKSIPVIGTNLDTGEEIRFESGAAAERELGLSGVYRCCKGYIKRCGNYKWRYDKTV